jgi:hypothetical protein
MCGPAARRHTVKKQLTGSKSEGWGGALARFGGPRMKKLPALLALGPIVVKKIDDFRRYVYMGRAFGNGASSLRKAYLLSLQAATTRGVAEDEVGSWETFRDAANQAEALFNLYFKTSIPLFIRLGCGMPWIGLTKQGQCAVPLAEELVEWHDATKSSPGAA